MIREMMAFGLGDPYSRFINPSEFRSMLKYDITTVGLNLGTAEEFSRKTGYPLPRGREASQVPTQTHFPVFLLFLFFSLVFL